MNDPKCRECNNEATHEATNWDQETFYFCPTHYEEVTGVSAFPLRTYTYEEPWSEPVVTYSDD